MGTPTPRLLVDGLACRRGGRLLFRDLSFSLDDGQCVSVRGPNGSGKTSLLRLIAGLGIPDDGNIRWREGSLRGQLGWLGHSDGLKADLSPRENIAYHESLVGGTGNVTSALARCGIAQFSDVICRNLSAGQRRRAALARLLVQGGMALWILDEPLTALDVQGQEMVEEMISHHRRDGGMVLVTSHQQFAGVVPDSEVVL